MINPINNVITGTVLIIFLSAVIIFSIIDPQLPFHWKFVVCTIAIILLYGSVTVMRDTMKQTKMYTNKEDLR